eukprot:363789-Chlamydomonas_euryale.AAC.3
MRAQHVVRPPTAPQRRAIVRHPRSHLELQGNAKGTTGGLVLGLLHSFPPCRMQVAWLHQSLCDHAARRNAPSEAEQVHGGVCVSVARLRRACTAAPRQPWPAQARRPPRTGARLVKKAGAAGEGPSAVERGRPATSNQLHQPLAPPGFKSA